MRRPHDMECNTDRVGKRAQTKVVTSLEEQFE